MTTIAAIEGSYDYERHLADRDKSDIVISYEDSRKLIYESSLVLSASGTATLETGIIGRPMVILYKTGFLTYHIARHLIKLDMIGLINLVLGCKVVPELIQNDATPEKMSAELEKYILDDTYLKKTKTELDKVAKVLGGTGASERAGKLILDYLK